MGHYGAYRDVGGGLGPDQRQGTWTYTAWATDRAGNVSALSNELVFLFDSVAHSAWAVDLTSAVCCCVLQSDNLTNAAIWEFIVSAGGEAGTYSQREVSPIGRNLVSSAPLVAGGAFQFDGLYVYPGGYMGHYGAYPDVGGGLGPDQRQGTWTYTAWATDRAGNVSALSNELAITFDSVAPSAPVLDLPAAQDSGVSQSDNLTNAAIWEFIVSAGGEAGTYSQREVSPIGRNLVSSAPLVAGGAFQFDGLYVYPGGYMGHYGAYPDVGGGLGPDQRQGTWTYTAWATDRAANVTAFWYELAITFDSL